VYDFSTEELVEEYTVDDEEASHNDYINIAVSPDGSLLAISINEDVIVWDLIEKMERYSFTAHIESIRSIAFSPDGLYLATSSRDGTVRLWGIAP